MTTPIRVGNGRKPAEETLREKLAFNDPDRSTPVHDEICLWLDNWLRKDENLWLIAHGGRCNWNSEYLDSRLAVALNFQSELLGNPKSWWRPSELAAWRYWRPPEAPSHPAPKLEGITWELAVGDERWVSGFIDVAAHLVVAQNLQLGCDHAICTPKSTVDYGTRSCCPPTWSVIERDRSFAFEVKSAIPSLGEVIRQVRYYERKHRATYYVVAPDDRHTETLADQGIGFIHYPAGTVTRPR